MIIDSNNIIIRLVMILVRIINYIIQCIFLLTIVVVHLLLCLMHKTLRVHLMLWHIVRVQGAPMVPQTQLHPNHNPFHGVIHLV